MSADVKSQAELEAEMLSLINEDQESLARSGQGVSPVGDPIIMTEEDFRRVLANAETPEQVQLRTARENMDSLVAEERRYRHNGKEQNVSERPEDPAKAKLLDEAKEEYNLLFSAFQRKWKLQGVEVSIHSGQPKIVPGPIEVRFFIPD